MVFTIESDEEIDYTAETPLRASDGIKMASEESQRLLPERVVGTTAERAVGTIAFCGAMALLSCVCCCFERTCHREEIIHTYNRHTLFGQCCPLFWRTSAEGN